MNSSSARRQKVLIIDDDPDFVYIVRRCLSGNEMIDHVSHALNGQEAIDRLKKISEQPRDEKDLPDVALLDINMPVMNGFEFLEALEKLKTETSLLHSIRIFIVSSSDSANDRTHAARYETVKKYLVKPVACELLTRELKA